MVTSLVHIPQQSVHAGIHPASSSYRRSRVFQSTRSQLAGNRFLYTVLIFLFALLITSARYLPSSATKARRAIIGTSQKVSSTHSNLLSNTGISTTQIAENDTKPSASSYFNPRDFPARRDSKLQLNIPEECSVWRQIARKPTQLRLYKKHFNSHDDTDWFLYTAIFGERWHMKRKGRPAYLDIAASHAKRWSSSWFFDRCMGWDGVCAQPNHAYWSELSTERTCRLINTCLSDRVRKINFSYTAAFSGVVAELTDGQRVGVDGALHENPAHFGKHFKGIAEITCSTLAREMVKRDGMAISHFDFMRLDVEGYEFPVLRGIDWNRTKIDVIVTENRREGVRQYLNDLGYKLFPGLLKTDIWIWPESGIRLDPLVLDWMNAFNKSDKTFGPSVVDDPQVFLFAEQTQETSHAYSAAT